MYEVKESKKERNLLTNRLYVDDKFTNNIYSDK